MKKRGFTLIELLIVVAIIAILAAIAVPNFLEAQMRSKVARCRNDIRTLSMAFEAYTVDNNRPPLDYWDWYYAGKTNNSGMRQYMYTQLTSPIAYLTSMIPMDPFGQGANVLEDWKYFPNFVYYPSGTSAAALDYNSKKMPARKYGFTYSIWTEGPTMKYAFTVCYVLAGSVPFAANSGIVYDPSNGSVSLGYITRTNKGELTVDQIPH